MRESENEMVGTRKGAVTTHKYGEKDNVSTGRMSSTWQRACRDEIQSGLRLTVSCYATRVLKT